MSAITCQACGQPMSGTESFCRNCGVSASVSQAPVTAPIETLPAVQTVPVVATTQPVPAVEAAGTTVPWYRRQLTPPQLKRAGIIIVFLALLGGAFAYLRADGTGTTEELGELVAEGPIGPQGGELKFEKGGAVKVPSGALTRTETISVRRTPTRRVVRFPNGDRVPAGALPMYTFGPFNITFRRAITIVLPVSIDATGADIYLFTGGRLIFVAQRPNQGGTVTVRVSAFRAGRIIIVQG